MLSLFSILSFLQCTVKNCQGKGSKVHSLTKKSESLCIHTFLVLKAGLLNQNVSEALKCEKSTSEVNRAATIDEVVTSVSNCLPSATSQEKSDFIKQSKDFIEKIISKEDLSAELTKYTKTVCPSCKIQLTNWHHRSKKSYLISFSDLKEIKLNPKYCPKCKTLFYTDLYKKGIIPIHNKVCSNILCYIYVTF